MKARRWLVLSLLWCAGAWAERTCQSPDALYVDSRPQHSLSLYVWVPQATTSFTVGVFDQTDDGEAGKPSSFVLQSPDGQTAARLDQPAAKAWADYPVTTNGRWGVWRLRVTGPQPPQGKKNAQNAFMVRTVGEVDLYLLPDAAPRHLGLLKPQFGGEPVHRVWLQVPESKRLRVNLVRAKKDGVCAVTVSAPVGVTAKPSGLGRGQMEFVEFGGPVMAGLWPAVVEKVEETWRLGIEQESRVFFTAQPLMPAPRRVPLSALGGDPGAPMPVRVACTSPQTALESRTVFTDAETGTADLPLLPGIRYGLTITRGLEYQPVKAEASADDREVKVQLPPAVRRPAGWYCGDGHTHSIYSDGSDTPRQMIEAARAEGLDYLIQTDHGSGTNLAHLNSLHQEGAPFTVPGRFQVIAGEEFSTGPYHACVLGAGLPHPGDSPLQQTIDAGMALGRGDRPVGMVLNHPTWDGTPKAPELARELARLPLLELWNGPEPGAIKLWFELLNKGLGTFAVTNTDTHGRRGMPLGARRTYVYLGGEPLNATNVIKALLAGRSFLSRGAILDVTFNGHRSGDRFAASELEVKLSVECPLAVSKVEIVHNGEVVRSIEPSGKLQLDRTEKLAATPGWYVVQVLAPGSPTPLAMSNPVFVTKP